MTLFMRATVVLAMGSLLVSCGPASLSEWKGGLLNCTAFDELEGDTPALRCWLSRADVSPVDDGPCPRATSLTATASRGQVSVTPGGRPDAALRCEPPAFTSDGYDDATDLEVTLVDGATTVTVTVPPMPKVALKADKTMVSRSQLEAVELRRVDDGTFSVPVVKNETWNYAGGDTASNTTLPIAPTAFAELGPQTVRIQHSLHEPEGQSTFFAHVYMHWWVTSSIELTVIP